MIINPLGYYKYKDRQILHLDLDTFFISVERLINSKLIDKPVIVGGFSDRSVVASCSYETRRFGVHAGMPMKLAKRLCSEAIILRGDMDNYSKYSGLITEIIKEKAPVFEKASIDEFYIDLTGMDKFFGSQKWSKELRNFITKESGLPISLGLSTNKTTSKITTNEAKPGELFIPEQLVLPFIQPLSIKKMPGIGNKTFRILRQMGIYTIKNLSDIPLPTMEYTFGKNGVNFWKKSNGIDNTPIIPYQEPKSISIEKTFDKDSTDYNHMLELIVLMTERLCFQLRKQNKLTGIISVKIRYSNFETPTLQRKISYTSFDYHIEDVAKDLFGRIYNRRLSVRLIGLKFDKLIYGTQQLQLFDDKVKLSKLYKEVDFLKKKFGHKIIRKAIAY
ncbi:MAG: DNA polymerase IV [Bacteroidales bacterium]|nr:DNA polymerase IV [Bacteroidales bacterium]